MRVVALVTTYPESGLGEVDVRATRLTDLRISANDMRSGSRLTIRVAGR